MEPGRDALESLLADAGETGPLTLAVDWSQTSAGPPRDWPVSVRTAVGICFSACTPTLVGIGPDLLQVYNDAFVPIFGSGKHPESIGRSWRSNFAEIWGELDPLLTAVLERGEPARADDRPFLMERGDLLQESYFTFSFTPIRDDEGHVTAVFCPALETTDRVVGERRLRTLSDLAAEATQARDVEGVVKGAATTLARNPADLPFCLLYLLTPDGGHARLATTVGLAPGAGGPDLVSLSGHDDGPWPLAHVVASGQPLDVADLGRAGQLTALPDEHAPTRAVVLPLRDAAGGSVGVLVTGISRHRPLDEDYRSFLSLVCRHLEGGLGQAAAEQTQRERVEALAALDRAKTEFFSNVSHEFRTPLTLLMGPLEEALADPDLDPRQHDLLDTASRNAQRLLKLVNTLLSFSRLEAGRLEASYVPTDLAALTGELASVFRSAVSSAGLGFEVDCPPLAEPVHVDQQMWEQVVLNLLSNALKFTFTGDIRVVLGAESGAAVLTVSDTGGGIPAEELPRLFERFHQVRNTPARTHEGSGIGLALVHDLVDLHGGTITVSSTVGVGTAFRVVLPLGTDHLPADQVGAPPQRPAQSDLREAYVAGVAPPRPGRAPRVRAQHRPRVLVADDNADMLAYIQRLLAPEFAVECAADGRAALAAAERRPPDLVLSDVMMPGLDGFGLLQALRSRPETARIPVLLLSARAGEEATHEGLAAGADDYLVKPFSARELLARVRAQVTTTQQRAAAEDALRRADDERREREHASRFAMLAGATTDFVGMADPTGRVLYLNRSGRLMLGIDPDEDLSGTTMYDYVWPTAALHYAGVVATVVREGTWRGDVDLLHRDGHQVTASQVLMAHRDESGELAYFGTIVRDVSAERAASERLQLAEARFRHAFDDAPVGMAILDGRNGADAALSGLNPALRRLLERTSEALVGSALTALVVPEERERTAEVLDRVLTGEASCVTWQACLLRTDGSTLQASLAASATSPSGGSPQLLLHVQDITERARYEDQLQHLADHDSLTGLLNRRRLLEQLDREVSAARRYGTTGALFLLDLDDFKYVNDSLGHAAGDDLLVRATHQLTHRLRESDTLARLGGDEFGVIVPHVDEQQARDLATDLLETIRGVNVGARRLTASVGIALFGPDGAEPPTSESLLLQADTAMYDAKESGRAQVAVFDRSNVRQTGMELRLDAAERLREALACDRLVLHGQPIRPARGTSRPHVELLVRMRSESGALVPPAEFLDVAAQFDLIRTIDRWVISEAVRLAASTRAQGRPLQLSTNLSAQSILDPDLPDWIVATVLAGGADGADLVFEVTETDAAVNYEGANRLAERLGAIGCRFALDDFGTGFCSLHYIKHLHFDYLKIDSAFVRDLCASEADQLIVRAAIDIAHGLGRKAVAEGVEDEPTLELLRSFGIDYVQGFHLGAPGPITDLLARVPRRDRLAYDPL